MIGRHPVVDGGTRIPPRRPRHVVVDTLRARIPATANGSAERNAATLPDLVGCRRQGNVAGVFSDIVARAAAASPVRYLNPSFSSSSNGSATASGWRGLHRGARTRGLLGRIRTCGRSQRSTRPVERAASKFELVRHARGLEAPTPRAWPVLVPLR